MISAGHPVIFSFGSTQVTLFLPKVEELKYNYFHRNVNGISFPYWAKVWPAAKALACFITSHSTLITGKKVVEIAGGLGLPSFIAASLAREVICTDADEDALLMVKQSIELNRFTNIEASVFNWNTDASEIDGDVLLMSDVNYDPSQFEALLTFIKSQLQKGTTILLSTPQRLMAKPFIETLLPFIVYREEMEVEAPVCNVFILKVQS